jgi:hypothetical protein
MASMQEFMQIADQLEWLEGHVREQQAVTGGHPRLGEALSALACARAVVVKLAQIGSEVAPARPVHKP